MELKDWIRAVRLSLKLSQTDFGTRFFVTKGNVSAWEHGRHSPSFDQIARMSQMSGMSLPGGTNTPAESVKYDSDLPRSSNSPAREPETEYAPTEITYEVVKGAVTGVLCALGVRFEDLVVDEAAAREHVDAALRTRSSPSVVGPALDRRQGERRKAQSWKKHVSAPALQQHGRRKTKT